MKLYALSRPLPRGRVSIGLIPNGSSGFFKFDTHVHSGHNGILPTGFKATTTTVSTVAAIIGTPLPADIGDLTRRQQSLAVHLENASAVTFIQSGSTNEIIIQPIARASNDFILSIDLAGN